MIIHNWSRILTLGIALLSMVTCSSVLKGQVVNIDFNAYETNSIHSGADGVLSTSGTVWNAIYSSQPSPITNLIDELGAPSAISIEMTSGIPYVGTASNDLQDTGIMTTNIIRIMNLDMNKTYNLALYFTSYFPSRVYVFNGEIYVIKEQNFSTGRSFSLPGREGDYFLFQQIKPSQFGTSGVFETSIYLAPSTPIAGLQICPDLLQVSNVGLSNDSITLNLSGLTLGTTNSILRSTNLMDPAEWLEVTTFVSTVNQTNWTEFLPGARPAAYYRVISR